MNLDEFLYPDLLHANWQMSNSERLALMQLLARIKPQVSIEVGTYQGGSLSLISRASNLVYSLDIDAGVAERYARFTNTRFITGDSASTLPTLLRALESSAAPVEFILIDGDHSPEGIRRDLNAVLAFRPTKRVFVVCHDSFNPGCRGGMLSAAWSTCPNLAFTNLDFVPGTVVQQGGPFDGQMWGGLALFVLDPANTRPAPIHATASMLFDRALRV